MINIPSKRGTAAPVAVGTANAEGVAVTLARSDHVHSHGAQTDGSLHAAATTGAAGFLSAADKTKLDGIATGATNSPLTASAPVNVTTDAAAVGVSTEAARSDHKHDVTTAAPSTVGTANAEGTASALARADHVHDHGSQAGGSLHAAVIAGGAAGFMTGADKTKLDGVATGATSTPLSSSLPAAVGSVAVGVSANAARADHVHAHGDQAGGTLHSAATTGAAGFMSAADKTKLDGVASGATATALSSTAPVNVTKATASAGVASDAARQDHKHDIATAAPSTLGTANSEGTSSSLARADHVHGHGAQTDGSLHAAVVAAGASGFMTGADKTKLDGIAVSATNTPLTAAAPANVTKATASVGVSTDAARADHKHDITTAAPSTVGTANSEGTSTSLARADHVHNHGAQTDGSLHAAVVAAGASGFMTGADKTKLDGIAAGATATALTASAPVNVTKAAASVGVATDAARADHKHDITTAAPSTVGTANSEGTATSLARSDHVHSHGAQTDGSLHAAAVAAGASGFMTGADKTKLDGIAASATNTPLTAAAPADITKAAAVVGVATAAARADHKHDVSTAVAGAIAIGDSAAEGSATSLARSDHRHSLGAPAAPATLGTANATGASSTAARADHVHAHGAQTDGSLHAAASESVAGFLSAADKIFLNTLVASGEPSGFPNRTDSLISRVDGTRTFTIQPAAATFDYYYDGTRRTVSAAETVVWPNTDGIHFIYYNGVTLTTSMTPWDLTDSTMVPIAAVLWDATGGKSFVMEERHGLTMDGATHLYLHTTQGTQLVSGGTITAGTYALNGTVDADNNFGIDATVIADEDIRSSIAALIDGNAITRMWREDVAGAWHWDTSAIFPKVGSGGTYIAYNDSSWTLTDLASDEYVNWWLFVVPTIDAVNHFVLIPGHAKHTSLSAAQAEGVNSIAWGNVPFTESAVLAQITYRTNSAYTTTGKCRIESVAIIRGTSLVINNGGATITDLGLANRGASTLDVTSSNGADVTLPAATTALTGLLTAADKTKLDGVATGATATPLASTTPADVGTGAVGVGTTAARADHVHGHGNQAGGSLHSAVIAGGASGFMTGADKTKLDGVATGATATPLASATPADVGTAAVGVGTTAARADHVHGHGNLAGGSLHADVIAAGASGFMTGADKTKLDGVATGATATPLSSAAPQAVGTAAAGTSGDASRADHVHAHGDQGGGTLHAAATTGANGFMSSTDKSKLDAATRAILDWGNTGIAATTTTRYMTPGWGDATAGTVAIQRVMPCAGTLKNLYVIHNTAPGSANTVVYTVRKNGVATGLTVTVAANSTTPVGDTTHTVTVAAGDRIDIEVTKAASVTTSPGNVHATLEVQQ